MQLIIVMDPIESINPNKDSTLAMMVSAQSRGYSLLVTHPTQMRLSDGQPQAWCRAVKVSYDPKHWYEWTASTKLVDLNVEKTILMRKDPPFDMDYIYSTHILQRAEDQGAKVVNRPQALRDANEKLFTAWFPQCCAPTLVSARSDDLRDFAQQQSDIILKPLDGMGGASIFKTSAHDPNLNVIIETLTQHEKQLIMAQQFVPEIADGDKRILLVAGQAVPYALARIPSEQDFRGNLAKGGYGRGQALSAHDHWIAEQVGPELLKRGVLFAGLDVIGDYLTEINVTSPTCIRELDTQFDLNISDDLFDAIEAFKL